MLLVYSAGLQPCRARIDLMFILDGSGSIPRAAFRNMTIFVGQIVRNYMIGPNAIQVGLIRYSTEARLAIQLGQFPNQMELLNEIILQDDATGGVARTDLALQLAMSELTGTRSRPFVPKVAVLFTNGASNRQALTTAAAANLRSRGVVVFAVGIGPNVNLAELNRIATDLDEEHVFLPRTFSMEELGNFTAAISSTTCSG